HTATAKRGRPLPVSASTVTSGAIGTTTDRGAAVFYSSSARLTPATQDVAHAAARHQDQDGRDASSFSARGSDLPVLHATNASNRHQRCFGSSRHAAAASNRAASSASVVQFRSRRCSCSSQPPSLTRDSFRGSKS
ncbi:hypothetical protein VIGAN_07095300, partial [Vigna angularis var. angularis]